MTVLKQFIYGKYAAITIAFLAFISINTYLMVKEIYYAAFIPLAIILFFLIVKLPDYVIFLIAILTPLSFTLKLDEFSSTIDLPTEPIIFLLTFMAFVRFMLQGLREKSILKNPLTIVILFNLIWIFITTITSTLPLVSLKFFISRLFYVVVFYFLGLYLFKNLKNIKLFIWLFCASLVLAVIVILFQHSQFYFSQEWSNKVTDPFFKDHTIYGAILAFFIPIMAGYVIYPKAFKLSPNERLLSIAFLGILLAGLVFSYTRAAWMSVAAAVGYFIIMLLRMKFRYQLIFAGMLAIFIIIYWPLVKLYLANTKSVSSDDLKDHLQSVSNISTDLSNTERINRWEAAVRMFKEKPVFGWGPGTYLFKYAPYQLSRLRTPISTNFGTLGNAHSEYIGPLSESGFLGMLSIILLALIVVYKGLKIYYKSDNQQVKMYAMIITLSLITYFAHGLVNNFLHTDKASVPFWSFIAIIAALDHYHFKRLKEQR